jgi:hypothetical protein
MTNFFRKSIKSTYKATPEQWAETEAQVQGYPYATESCVLELRARIEQLEEAAANHPAKPDSAPAPSGSLVNRVQVAIKHSYPDDARAAIRAVAAWLRDSEGDYSTIRQLEMQADTTSSQED